MSKLVLALPKGRLLKEVSGLLLSANLIDKPIEEGRKLVLETEKFKILLAKPKDVPMLVESGFADVGVSGWDTIWESQREVLEILDLKVGFCRICIAGFPESVSNYPNLSSIKVATKYPNIARTYFEQKGVKPFVYVMNGSVELAPVIGLTDYILDLVQTGRTLRENGLVVVEEISTSTARLIAGRESFYLKNEEILSLAEKLHQAVETSF
ncbi:MAG TPA: ATP phosphoribosyltransferase [Aquifex aeolicus]|uniref:ATP phosphoribosyltransferase n=1 Tax=Aquifex aeolicus TaxID=63363 RepID=A0A9D0YPQ5_AQUAO|nr:ATP phosphoribosyltransferase [Aquificales bacterium]HIP98416.1 ATP phosphoribosyltransferase [Aquifex aeolicus]HIQ26413.1 ATP phosphoribosyltransferase [Aquifex aeolicus]